MKFAKLSGAGNDFVLVDASLAKGTVSWPSLARRLCPRRVAVGADGLLVVFRRSGTPELDYYNSDGSRAFCGNGSRCAAWWMFTAGWAGRRFTMDTISGPVACEIVSKERVRIGMPDARGLKELKVKAGGKTWRVGAIDTGVPHAVVRAPDLDSFPVFEIGRALRRSRAFAPAGANVNFIAPRGKAVRIRTYERGVEDETLACGTGAVAAALLTSRWLGRKSPVSVETRGGTLKISFAPARGGRFTDIQLEGPARITFTGDAP